MQELQFAALLEDVRVHGARVPVILVGGRLADGRHRWKACQELDLACLAFECDDGPEVANGIFGANVARRHLKSGQIAMMAAKWATRGAGRPNNVTRATNRQLDLGRWFGMSRRLLRSGRTDMIDRVWNAWVSRKAALWQLPARPARFSNGAATKSPVHASSPGPAAGRCRDERKAGTAARPESPTDASARDQGDDEADVEIDHDCDRGFVLDPADFEDFGETGAGPVEPQGTQG